MNIRLNDLSYGIRFDEENTIEGIDVRFDADILNWSGDARYPYYQLRGVPVTPEQAFDLICFAHGKWLFFGIDWFEPNSGGYGESWVFPSGYVGADAVTGKYPELFELVYDWVVYVEDFPYLDLVVGISDWDEMSPSMWALFHAPDEDEIEPGEIRQELDYDEIERRMAELKKSEYYKFAEAISLGIWVHDGKIEFLSPKKFLPIFNQYNKKYPLPFYGELRSSKFWNDKRPAELTRDYIERVLNKCGKDPADEKYAWQIKRLFERKRPCEMSEFFSNNNV